MSIACAVLMCHAPIVIPAIAAMMTWWEFLVIKIGWVVDKVAGFVESIIRDLTEITHVGVDAGAHLNSPSSLSGRPAGEGRTIRTFAGPERRHEARAFAGAERRMT